MNPRRKEPANPRFEANFDTFQPHRLERGPNIALSEDEKDTIWMEEGEPDPDYVYRPSEQALPPMADITAKDKVMLDFNYKVTQNSYEKTRKSVFLDVISKINHFKLSGTSRIRVTEYMTRKSREDKLVYPFGVERDPLVLKVLSQVLYDELEKSIRIGCTGPTPLSKAKADQALLDSMSEAVTQLREEEKQKHLQHIQELKHEIAVYKNQINRKNDLINRLFSDKTLLAKYFDDFSMLFTDSFRYLHGHSGKEAASLMDRLAKANDFLRWAKEYGDDERRYIVDKDWRDLKEREKKNLFDESDLDKSKVWAYKQQQHLDRISPFPSPVKSHPDTEFRLNSGGHKPSKSLDASKLRVDHKPVAPEVSKRLFDQTEDRNQSQGKKLMQAGSLEEFTNSFNNMTYEQLQEFCLALSDQLTQSKKESKAKLADANEKLKVTEEEYKYNKKELLSIIEAERKSREQSDLETTNMKEVLTEGWSLAFDIYNLIVMVSKSPSYQKPFARFMIRCGTQIADGYILTRSFLSKVDFPDRSIAA